MISRDVGSTTALLPVRAAGRAGRARGPAGGAAAAPSERFAEGRQTGLPASAGLRLGSGIAGLFLVQVWVGWIVLWRVAAPSHSVSLASTMVSEIAAR